MQPTINPYIRSGVVHPQRLIVAQKVERELFSPLVNPGGSVAVTSERGIGKSSLLGYIAHPPDNWRKSHLQQHVFVAFNCPDTVIPFAPERFWLAVVRHLEQAAPAGNLKQACAALLADEKLRTSLTHEQFITLLDLAAGAQLRIVLVLDDFDAFVRTDRDNIEITRNFLSTVRGLTTRHAARANVVLSTRRSLEELCKPLVLPGSSPFQNGFTAYALPLMREQELERLCDWAVQSGQPSFTREERTVIRYLSGSHPQLAQIAAYELLEQRFEVGGPLHSMSAVGERFKISSAPVFESLWEGASATEQLLLMLLALQRLSGKVSGANYSVRGLREVCMQHERDIHDLANRRLVVADPLYDPAWSLFSPIFHWWVLKEIESGSPEQIQSRRQIWGNLLTQQHLNRVVEATELVRKNMGWIEQFGKLVLPIAGALT